MEHNLKLVQDAAENELAIAKLTEEDNVEQEPSIKAIESQGRDAKDNLNAKAAEVIVKAIYEKINAATDVEMVKVADLYTDEASFQKRSGLWRPDG